MARLVAGFGSSHSPMLTTRLDDWLGEAFTERDRARMLVDADGNDCRYDDVLASAPPDATARITPAALADRHAEAQDAIRRLRDDVIAAHLDALVVVGDDQSELFDDTNTPSIGVYHGDTIRNARSAAADSPLGVAMMRFREPEADRDYPCDAAVARHLIGALQQDGFDLSVMSAVPDGRFEGHAYSYVHRFCMGEPPIPLVPVFLNAYSPLNQPSPARCHALGQGIARAVATYPAPSRIGIMASGGLSHFLVDEAFDRAVIEALRRKDSAFFRDAPLHKLRSGSAEIRNWICLAGAVAHLDLDWVTYVPGYRTPALTGTGLCFARFK